jgi:hypothetical protein
MKNLDNLKMELVQLNEAIDMATMVLDRKEDPQMVAQLKDLLKKREDVIQRLERIQ